MASPAIELATLTNRATIQNQLAALTLQESALNATLATLIESQSALSDKLAQLSTTTPIVEQLLGKSQSIAHEISNVSSTAYRVATKVRKLDDEQSKVNLAITVVQEVQDLKNCIGLLDIAIEKQDWESATRYLHRTSSLDPKVIQSGFADAVVPTSNLPLTPSQTLANLRATLLDTFLTSFREASANADTNNINRFFKLFPMIGEDLVGLQVYSEWVCGIVWSKMGGSAMASTGKVQAPTHFSTLLTRLFESLALILSQHQPVVEKYYGTTPTLPPPHTTAMTYVTSCLLQESDKIGVKILENWRDERGVTRKLNELRSGAGGRTQGLQHGEEVDNRNEVREVDAVVAELAVMSGRWQLLRRFLYSRLRDTDEDDEAEGGDYNPDNPDQTTPKPTKKELEGEDPPLHIIKASEEAVLEAGDLALVEEAELGKLISTELRNSFEPMEVWYLRCSVEKAHQLDSPDFSNLPHLSTSLDDIFYLIKKTLYRILSTASIDTTVSLTREVKRILDRDVAEVWRSVMEGIFRDLSSSGATTGLGGAKAKEEERERREKEAGRVYIVYLNNLDTAAEYTVRLMEEMLAGETLEQAFFLGSELERAKLAVLGLRAAEEKFRSVLKSSLDNLFNQILRPRLRPILAEVYRDVSYTLDEDSYADAEYRDDVRKRFIKSWEGLISGYQESFTPSNYNLFFATAVNVLVRPWEGIIRSMKFTELGALRLDRDLRSVLSYLSSQSSFSSGSLRESFSRLQQIATLLTLDSLEEAEEVLGATGNRLTESEMKTIWGMRIQ